MSFSLTAVKTFAPLTFSFTLGGTVIVLLCLFLLVFLISALPTDWIKCLRFPVYYALEKRSVWFVSQCASLVFGLLFSISLWLGALLINDKDPDEVRQCQGIGVCILVFAIMAEMAQSVFLLDKAKATKDIWENNRIVVIAYKILQVLILLFFPIITVLAILLTETSHLPSDNDEFRSCSVLVPDILAIPYALNNFIVNFGLFAIFYTPIHSVKKSLKAIHLSKSTGVIVANDSTSKELEERIKKLDEVSRRNFVSCFIICLSSMTTVASATCSGNLGIILGSYGFVHMIVSNCFMVSCTRAAWKTFNQKVESRPSWEKNQPKKTAVTSSAVQMNVL